MGERKYFLDWLRVTAFFLLILFHVGLFYVPWYYNIKSPRISNDLVLYMNLLSPWRLTLLFFISGVASRFLIAKLGAGGFARDRVRRLLPVLLVGMFLINPVQVYVEVLWKQVFDGSYLQFWFGPYLHNGYWPYRLTPNWDHLWFLVYLLFYALLVAAVFGLRKDSERRALPVWLLVALPALWLAGTNVLVTRLQPVTDDFVHDWANHIRWFGIYATGIACAGQAQFWEALRLHRRKLAFATMALLPFHIVDMMLDFGTLWNSMVYDVIAGLYGWCAILTLCGYAGEYWNRSSRALSYLNEAVLPVYVFHQPVMLVLGYNLFPLDLPIMVEVPLLVLGTGAGSFLGYEILARRTRLLRFLFGLRQVQPESRSSC